MANQCSSQYAFFTKDDKNKGELLRLYTSLINIVQTSSDVVNGSKLGCLSMVADKHGIDTQKISCDGSFKLLGSCMPAWSGQGSFFVLASETGWTPKETLWEAVTALYNGISFVYLSYSKKALMERNAPWL